MTTPNARARTALLTGLTTTAYYAVPDVARTRTTRGWLKAACLAVGAAQTFPTTREGWQELRPTWTDVPDPTTGDAEGAASDDDATDDAGRPSWLGRAAVVGVGVAVIAAGVAGTVAAERWVFRRGEARAAAGVRFAHTRTAVVLGAASALLALLPEPSERPDAHRG